MSHAEPEAFASCPLCCGTRLDPRSGLAPREVMIYLEDRLPPSMFVSMAEALRNGESIKVEIDPPPAEGIPQVDVIRRKRHPGKKKA